MNLQPNELRLGILVYDSLRQKNITIQLKHFRELAISEKSFFDRYKAVEISEELLLEMGFESDKITFWKKGVNIGWYASGFRYLPSGSIATPGIFINSIHQLQNLFHSIAGEELIFTDVNQVQNTISSLNKQELKTVELWLEGYRSTGQGSKARKIGQYKAIDFKDAVNKYIAENPETVDVHEDGNYTIWGCRIFDNKKEAQQYFG